MKNIFILMFVIVLSSCFNNSNDVSSNNSINKFSEVDSLKNKAKIDANNDYINNEMKYYFHSIAYPDSYLIQEFAKHSVSLVSRNCILNNYEMNYNKFIDRILYKKDKIVLSSIINN